MRTQSRPDVRHTASGSGFFATSTLGLFACLLITAAPLALHAQDGRTQQGIALEGSYVYAPEESDDIEQAIEAGIDDMNFIVRAIARRRLRNTNQPYRRVRIDIESDSIVTTFDDREPISAPADGQAVPWTREDGERMRLSMFVDGTELRQVFHAEDGSRENVFFLDSERQRLTMTSTIRSPRLPEPIVYELVYRRTSR